MPTSKKRVKKDHEPVKPVTRNITKTSWGRVIIVILALSFVLSGVVGLVYTLVQAMNA